MNENLIAENQRLTEKAKSYDDEIVRLEAENARLEEKRKAEIKAEHERMQEDERQARIKRIRGLGDENNSIYAQTKALIQDRNASESEVKNAVAMMAEKARAIDNEKRRLQVNR